ncbi:M48 family metalloprotease [Kitasatospora sp. DSM 101779]|uniref:M48 family metalloprotease n=1 Tax=Kitasatospora sp. DSM 101779 TaxID=2853165 RepID=UPI0021DA09D5|nr:M48 family metallopeptidase [Kitasatospora sp. DSM 101779]MCU7823098.1 M48 family metalloprotease [Kitasatospora sp. DSM 101779]
MGTTPPPAASTAGRAVLAVSLLAGFYLLAAAVVLGLLGLDVALYAALGHVNLGLLKIWALTAVVAYPVLRVVFLTRRPRGDADGGLLLTREQQPGLWARVDRIAELTGVRGPAEIRLVPDVNAGVREDTRLLGLIPGKRHLVIGAPLLIGLTEGELDSVLAHEFGHYSNRDVRLAGVTVAGRSAILHTVGTLHRRADRHQAEKAAEIAAKDAARLAKDRKSTGEEADGGVQRALAKVFTLYAKLYFRVSEAVSRRQEYAADRTAATVAGRAATASALRRIPALDAAQGFYLDRYATLGWDAGALPLPGQFYGGLAHLLADPARRRELEELGLPEGDADPYDSHPPIDRRIAAVEALPDDGRTAGEGGPALALLRDPERTLAALEAATLVPEAATKQHLDWPELLQAAGLAGSREAARPVRQALTDSGLPPTLQALLDAVDAGRGFEIAGRLPRSEQSAAATGRAAREFLRPVLRAALSRAAVLELAEAGLAHWEFSWSVPAELRLPDGLEDELPAALDAAVADTPETGPLRALLAAAGLVPASAAPADGPLRK